MTHIPDLPYENVPDGPIQVAGDDRPAADGMTVVGQLADLRDVDLGYLPVLALDFFTTQDGHRDPVAKVAFIADEATLLKAAKLFREAARASVDASKKANRLQ